jgi:hypothetical protein
LPPTGLQQQLASLQQRDAAVSSMSGGIDPQSFLQAQLGGGQSALPEPAAAGTTSLQQLGNQLATQYGLDLGRGDLFDASGNPMMTPEQLAAASGGQETMGTAAAKMNFIADALAKRQTEGAQEKAEATLQSGIGLVQSRARGSLATLQSGLYSQMANLYANQEYEAADFSYYIQREQNLIQQKLQRKAEKRAKKSARVGSIMGAIGLVAAPFTGGATLGLAAQGLGQLGNTGWI